MEKLASADAGLLHVNGGLVTVDVVVSPLLLLNVVALQVLMELLEPRMMAPAAHPQDLLLSVLHLCCSLEQM